MMKYRLEVIATTDDLDAVKAIAQAVSDACKGDKTLFNVQISKVEQQLVDVVTGKVS